MSRLSPHVVNDVTTCSALFPLQVLHSVGQLISGGCCRAHYPQAHARSTHSRNGWPCCRVQLLMQEAAGTVVLNQAGPEHEGFGLAVGDAYDGCIVVTLIKFRATPYQDATHQAQITAEFKRPRCADEADPAAFAYDASSYLILVAASLVQRDTDSKGREQQHCSARCCRHAAAVHPRLIQSHPLPLSITLRFAASTRDGLPAPLLLPRRCPARAGRLSLLFTRCC